MSKDQCYHELLYQHISYVPLIANFGECLQSLWGGIVVYDTSFELAKSKQTTECKVILNMLCFIYIFNMVELVF